MTDAPHSSVAFAPYRDSVDEEAPPNPNDVEAGTAEPGAPATQGWRISRLLDLKSAIIASRVLLVASATFFLLSGPAIATAILPLGDTPGLNPRIRDMVELLGINVRPLLSLPLHYV